MRSYFAKQGSRTYQGSRIDVLVWARLRLTIDPMPVQLLTARAGEKNAHVIAEVTPDEERMIQCGRMIRVKVLCG